MPQYLLALYDDPTQWSKVSPEDMQAIIEKYTSWTNELRRSRRLVVSEKLVDDGGRLLRKSGTDVRVMDGPFTETKEVLGGFYVIEAESYEDAIAQARACPHLEYGPIEVRQIDVI